MIARLTEILESLGVFVIILGVWTVFAYMVAGLTSFLPGENMVILIGGGVTTLGLFVAIGVASRIVRRRLTRFSDSGSEAKKERNN